MSTNSNFFIFLGMLTVAYLLVLRNIGQAGVWRAAHWVFSVQEGYISRAFVGSLIQLALPEYHGNYEFINFFSLLVTIVLASLITIFSYRFVTAQSGLSGQVLISSSSITRLLLALVFITSPATIQFFANDVGRLDQIGLTIGLLVVLVFSTVIDNNIRLIIVSVASIVLTLIHEAFIFLVVPLIVACYLADILIKHNDKSVQVKKEIIKLTSSLLPAIIIFITIFRIGRFDYDDVVFYSMLNNLREIADFEILEGALAVHFRSLSDNFLLLHGYLTTTILVNIVVMFISLIPSISIGFIVLKKLGITLINELNDENRQHDAFTLNALLLAITVCVFSPLFLMLIATDYPRWLSAFVVNLYIIFYYVSSNINMHIFGNKLNYILLFVISISLALGPISASIKVMSPSSLGNMLELMKYLIVIISNLYFGNS